MNYGLASRTALITGSSRGIGRAVALKLAEQGAAVVVNGHQDQEAIQRVVREVQERGGRAVGVLANLAQPQEAARLVQVSGEHFGGVDILVNNAGIVRDELLLRLKEEDWDQVLDTNLKGAFLCTQAALRSMLKQRWGRIINISSVAGLVGNAGQTNYASAKGGLIAFTKSLAKEIASRGITVNAIAPGFIDTQMTRRLSEAARQEILKHIPLGYMGTPEDVAEAVAFLASEGARYITGHVLTVDGGLTML